jgi:hypothetical protein
MFIRASIELILIWLSGEPTGYFEASRNGAVVYIFLATYESGQ